MERRLSAILAADMVGYSRLMEADEEGTIARQKLHRAELIDPKIAEHGGRLVKSTGDGALIEFPSVVDAVRCAVALQRGMAERETDLPEDRRIRYRIGINLGDIVIDGDDLLGDGVNVAARLEGLATPGGICISGKVMHEVRDKVDVGFEFTGEQKVKNIQTLVPVYRIRLEADAAGTVVGEDRRRPRGVLLAAGVAALAAVAIGLAWWQPWAPRIEPASVERMTFPLPDRPSIAVLPFDNMSGDDGQDYFADGMTEDLITDLSKIPGLFVIARNSAFIYKGAGIPVRQVAEDLGVRYVLEGSVRRSGDQVRINAQLLDATSGGHLWADRYDGTLGDVFGLQDSVTRHVVAAIATELGPQVAGSAARPEAASAEAYEAFLRGWAYYRDDTPEAFATAVPYFEKAIAIEPDHARAHAALADIYWRAEEKRRAGQSILWLAPLGLGTVAARAKGDEHLAIALRHPTPLAHQVASGLYTAQGSFGEAIREAERAIALDVNNPAGHQALAKALIFAGRPQEAIGPLETAIRLDPNFASAYLTWLGVAQLSLEDYPAAVDILEGVLESNPGDDLALVVLISALGHTGRIEEAKAFYADLNALRKKREAFFEQKASGLKDGIDALMVGPYTLSDVDFWPFAERADRERLRDGLASAGIPAEAAGAHSPLVVSGATTVDPAAAKVLFDRGVRFVDVRNDKVWKLGHIPGATLLDFKGGFSEESLLSVVGRDDPVVIYCEGTKCLRSSQACEMAVSWGFTRVHYLRQGFPGWKAAGHPVEVE